MPMRRRRIRASDAWPTPLIPPLSRWLKRTLTMSCKALGLAAYFGFVPQVLPLFKGQSQTGAELGSAGETHYQCR